MFYRAVSKHLFFHVTQASPWPAFLTTQAHVLRFSPTCQHVMTLAFCTPASSLGLHPFNEPLSLPGTAQSQTFCTFAPRAGSLSEALRVNTDSTIVNGGRIDLTKPQRGSGVQAAASAAEPDAVARRLLPQAPSTAHETRPSLLTPPPPLLRVRGTAWLSSAWTEGARTAAGATPRLRDLTRRLHLSEAGKAAAPIKPSAGTSIAQGAGAAARPRKLTHRTFFPKMLSL